MALEQPQNGVSTTLATAISSTSATTCSLTSATGFTNAQYHCLIVNAANTQFEIVEVTGLSGTTLTIVRGAETYGGANTSYTFAAGSTITVVTSVQSVFNMISQVQLPATQVANVVVNVTQSATPAITISLGNIFSITALAQNITSMTTNLTNGTPVHGQIIWIEITDNGVARSIAWGAGFTANSIALPVLTTAGKILRVGLTWNVVTSTWDCIGWV